MLIANGKFRIDQANDQNVYLSKFIAFYYDFSKTFERMVWNCFAKPIIDRASVLTYFYLNFNSKYRGKFVRGFMSVRPWFAFVCDAHTRAWTWCPVPVLPHKSGIGCQFDLSCLVQSIPWVSVGAVGRITSHKGDQPKSVWRSVSDIVKTPQLWALLSSNHRTDRA